MHLKEELVPRGTIQVRSSEQSTVWKRGGRQSAATAVPPPANRVPREQCDEDSSGSTSCSAYRRVHVNRRTEAGSEQAVG